jgi:hypothetical protein
LQEIDHFFVYLLEKQEYIMHEKCLKEEQIIDYMEDRLPRKARKMAEQHLSECDDCLEEVTVVSGIFRSGNLDELDSVPNEVTQAAVQLINGQTTPSQTSFWEKCRGFFSGLYLNVSDLFHLFPWAGWRLAPIRGSRRIISEDLVHLRKNFKEIDAEIEIERTGVSKAHIRVQIVGGNGKGTGVRVTLKRGERDVSSNLSDHRGYVLFEDLPYGHYRLIFSKDGVTLGDYSFKIKETRNGK